MNDHHPQCFLATACKHDYYDEPPVQCANCGEECICDRLRACEQRVREETAEDRDNVRDEAYAHGFNAGREHGEKRGFVRGVQAARDAVAAACGWRPAGRCSECTHALAAIDALRLNTADCLCPSPNPDCQHPTCPREGK